MEALAELRARLLEANDLASAAALLSWDQATYMPPGGAEARGRQIAVLEKLAHETKTDPAVGSLLGKLTKLPEDSADGAFVRVARRKYEQARRVPNAYVAEMSEHIAASYVAWTTARPANDFTSMIPYLEKTVQLSRQYADFFPGYAHPADPHMDLNDEGMTAASVGALFEDLRSKLVPLVRAIAEKPAPDTSFIHHKYPIPAQIEFGKRIITRLGYDFERGRQDFTHHPFMTKFSLGDVRITTRAKEDDFGDAFFSTVHEAGHAMYEQGIARELDGSPVGEGASAGVHESQSRLWENLVGRSRNFWHWALPLAKEAFPAELGDVGLDRWIRAVNHVSPSLIRVDADEVTYNLHVMIRVGLEARLLDGSLKVKDLPDAWHGAYQENLGVRAKDDRDGVLQDVHWYGGLIGGSFQGYTLGNLMSAQFFAAAERANPELGTHIAKGDFAPLRTWLTQNLYRHGSTYAPLDLVARVTGKALGTEDFMAYLWGKYGELYGVTPAP